MKPYLLVSLLLLSTLLFLVQGIRLGKVDGLSSTSDNEDKKEGSTLMEAIDINNDGGGGVVKADNNGCKLGDCVKNSGMNRKLMTKATTSSSSTTPNTSNKNHKKRSIEGLGGKEENLSVTTSLPEPKHDTWKRYPDIVDIAGMDYSPAKRKPPIHN